jgi:dTMP kinase
VNPEGPGRFIVLEGGEGAGKSTLARALAVRFRDAGHEVVLTREPGDTEAGEKVRELLHLELATWAEVFAFLVARAQLVTKVIRPALERGAVVICDRYEASTFAYQGWGRGLDYDDLERVNRLATGGLEPNRVLFLDLPPSVGLARKGGEDEALQTGKEELAFHERVRAGYLSLMEEAPRGQWLRLDATQPPDEVAEQAWSALREA